MLLIYEAVIKPDEEGFSVEFPDIDGCVTQGVDLQDACEMAYEALGLFLQSLRENGIPIPKATYGRESHGDTRVVAFAVDPYVDFSERLITVREACDMLGVSSQRIQALIRQGVLLSEKVGTSRMIDQDSVLRYKNDRKPAGRPRKTVSA